MAGPIQSALTAKPARLTERRLTTVKANAEATMATRTESSTSHTPYAIGRARWNASMPTKCMLQMPTPMATEPPASHARRSRPWATVNRAARSSAV